MSPAPAIPSVLVHCETLRDSYAPVRWHAARALGSLGPDAEAAIPALIDAVEDSDATVRRQAVYALQRISPDIEVTVPISALGRGQQVDRVRIMRPMPCTV